MRRPLILLLLLAALASAPRVVRADGSVYSMLGIGDLLPPQGGRSAALGSITAPFWSNTSIISENPASWTSVRTTKIQGAYGFDYFSTTNGGAQAYWGSSGIRGLTVAVPVWPAHGVTLAIGLRPLSSVDYAVDGGLQTLTDTITYVSKYTGAGGMSTFFLGTSYLPVSWLSVGAAFEYQFGAIYKNVDLLFNSSSLFNHTSIVNRYSPDCFDARLSAMASLGDLTLGVIARLPATINTQYKQTYLATTFGALDSSIDIVYKQDLPLALTAGATYRVGDYLFAGEFTSENWSAALVDGTHPTELGASTAFGAGVERMGMSTGSGFDKWAFRAGFRSRTNYVLVNSSTISEMFFTLGAGIPVNGASTLDLGLQYGTRGPAGNGLYQDRIFRLNGSLSINEMWFQRPE